MTLSIKSSIITQHYFVPYYKTRWLDT